MFGSLETSPRIFCRGPGYLPGFPIEAFGNGGFEMRADEITSAFSLPGGERKIVNLRGTFMSIWNLTCIYNVLAGGN